LIGIGNTTALGYIHTTSENVGDFGTFEMNGKVRWGSFAKNTYNFFLLIRIRGNEQPPPYICNLNEKVRFFLSEAGHQQWQQCYYHVCFDDHGTLLSRRNAAEKNGTAGIL
jgi:hypothetical protein